MHVVVVQWLTLCLGIVGIGGGIWAVADYHRNKSSELAIETLKEDLLIPKVLLAGAVFLLILAKAVTIT